LLFYNQDLNILPRAGLVHRLDKDTTGLILAAEAKSYKEYIEGYTIPSDATYNPDTIDAKVRKNRILTMTGGIR
jgi:23S rRNA-/tRNA-specific pseudouridylate synthase